MAVRVDRPHKAIHADLAVRLGDVPDDPFLTWELGVQRAAIFGLIWPAEIGSGMHEHVSVGLVIPPAAFQKSPVLGRDGI